MSAPARAGDIVKAGQLLAELDDKDLLLDQVKWDSERGKLFSKVREALASDDRANLVVYRSQLKEAEAQLSLTESKLARAHVGRRASSPVRADGPPACRAAGADARKVTRHGGSQVPVFRVASRA